MFLQCIKKREPPKRKIPKWKLWHRDNCPQKFWNDGRVRVGSRACRTHAWYCWGQYQTEHKPEFRGKTCQTVYKEEFDVDTID